MRRGLLIVCASLLAGGAFAGPAAAASSSQIYSDFAKHGKISGQYSRAELEAALKDALVEGYGAPSGAALAPAVRKELRHSATLGAQKQIVRTAVAGGALPFTGVDLGLIAIGGASLLLLGGSLRRLGRGE
jgi:hypothetical protein